MSDEPTHSISKDLRQALLRAKDWYDEREQLEEAIRLNGGIAERNQEDRDSLDRQSAEILSDVVEAIDRSWGF